MKGMVKRYLQRLHRCEKGTVAVTFMLSLPILLFVIAILTQYALIVNAQLTVDRAAQAAARTAMTALPTDPDVDKVDGDALVRRSAFLALSPLSPIAKEGANADGTTIADAYKELGILDDNNLAARYTYAADGATVTWQRLDATGTPINETAWEPGDYARAASQRIRVTVTYPFLLTVPAAKLLAGGANTVGGVSGRMINLTATADVQMTHGREAAANGNGGPQ